MMKSSNDYNKCDKNKNKNDNNNSDNNNDNNNNYYYNNNNNNNNNNNDSNINIDKENNVRGNNGTLSDLARDLVESKNQKLNIDPLTGTIISDHFTIIDIEDENVDSNDNNNNDHNDIKNDDYNNNNNVDDR